MKCNPLTWKFKTLSYIFLALLGFYVLFIFKKVHQVVVEVTIKDSNPELVWDFVADFNNVKKLNPTIEEFDITNESGNLDHWKYSVHYKEHLSHFPSIKNFATAHYSIKPDGKEFVIISNHNTCFFGQNNCVNSYSEFRFSKTDEGTKCTEQVNYECPIAFSILCYKEVMYQRNEIMKGLKHQFSQANKTHSLWQRINRLKI